MNTQKRFESGFTLIELLLAITLMSMLLALAYGGLRAATRAAASGQVVLEESGQIRMTHQFVRRQLNQMQPLPFGVSDDLDETRIVFEGSTDRIQFVAPMPGYLGQGGPQVQLMQLVNGDDGQSLVFSHQLLQGFDPDFMFERDPIVLLEGIKQAQFEFLSIDEDSETLVWSSHWDDPAVLPSAIRLAMEFGEEHRAQWPVLATRIRVDESATTATVGAQSYTDAVRSMIQRPRDSGQ